MGSHNFSIGAYYVAAQKNEENSPYVQGILTTCNTSAVTTGNAFADLLQGDFASLYSKPTPRSNTITGTRFWNPTSRTTGM